MNYQELSIKNLSETNKKLFDKVYKKYKFDLVIFVAKGAYLIGKDFAEMAGNVPLIEINATRKGGKLKKLLMPILVMLPESLKVYLRSKEMKSDIHTKDPNRDIGYNEEAWEKHLKAKKIIIVDDSIDTGYSAEVKKYKGLTAEKEKVSVKKSEVKVASLNLFDRAKEVYTPDYHLYENTMIKGPWSNDSKEHKRYIKMYENWKQEVYQNEKR